MTRIVELLVALNAMGGIASWFGYRWAKGRRRLRIEREEEES